MQIRWLAAALVLVMFLGMGTASHNDADWNLTNMEISSETVGGGATIAVLVSLEDADGDPISPSTFDEGIEIAYSYDRYDEFQYDFDYINGSGGRYVTHIPVSEDYDTIDVYAWYDGEHDTYPTSSDEGPHVNATFDPTGNETAMLDHEKPDSRDWYWAVENRSEQLLFDISNATAEHVDGATVNWTMYDWTGAQAANGTALEGQDNYGSTLTFPHPTNGFYFMDIEVWRNGERTGGGSASFLIDNQLELEIVEEDLVMDNQNKCDVSSANAPPAYVDRNIYTAICEKGIEFDITVEEMQNRVADPGIEWQINSTEELNGDGETEWTIDEGTNTFTRASTDTWTTSVSVPRYLNTTGNGTAAMISLNATADTPDDFHRNYAMYEVTEDPVLMMNTTPFDVTSRTADFLAQGDILEIREELRLPFSDDPIEQREVGMVEFSIMNESDSEIFNVSLGDGQPFPDENFDVGGTIEYDWESPASLSTGDYTLETVATDVYGESIEHTHDFSVTEEQEEGTNASNVIIRDIGSGISDYNDRLDRSFTEPGNYTGSLLLKNNVSESNEEPTVNISIPDALNETIDVNNTEGKGMPFTMAPNEIDEIQVNYTLPLFDTYQGTINITAEDSEGQYMRQLPVDLVVERDCIQKNGSVCVQADEREYNYDMSGDETIEVPVENIGSEAINVTMDVEGNLSSIVDEVTREIEGYDAIDINDTISISQADNGYYSGNLTFHENGSDIVRVPTTMGIAIPEGSVSVTLANDTFGTVVTGETFTMDVTIENTGDILLDDMTLTVDAFNASVPVEDGDGNVIELEEGENTTLTISLDTSEADSSEFTEDSPAVLEVQESDGPRGTAVFYGEIVDDIGDDIQNLNQDLTDAEDLLNQESGSLSETDLSDFEGQIADIESQIEEANQAWNNGDYEQAQTSYSEIQSSITELESQIESAASESTGGENGGGENGGETNGGGDDDDDETTNNGGGGFNPLLIVIPLLLIIIIGVVVYLSIVPEDEGEQAGGGMDYGPPT